MGRWGRRARRDERGRVAPALIVVGTIGLVVVVALLALQLGGSNSKKVDTGETFDTVQQNEVGPCGVGQPDPTYTLVFESDPNPPKVEGTVFHITVRHNGTAVSGAKVCMGADMPGMQHAGVNKQATEGPGGKYDVALNFSMGGPWSGTVTVSDPSGAIVSLPVAFEVKQ